MLKSPSPGIWLLLVLLAAPIQVSAQGRGRIKSSNGVSVSPGTRHPTPENIPEAYPAGLTLHESRYAEGIDRVFPEGIGVDSVVIGVPEGEHHEMFGYIVDVATDGNGTLYVLDSEYNEVRVFDYSGNFLGLFGGPGEGPGEFRTPREIAVSGRTVFVVGQVRVNVFERQESGFLLRDFFSKDGFGLNGNCSLDGRLYTAFYNPEEEHVVHRYSADGVREASFVEVYRSENRVVQSAMSTESLLACSEKHRTIGVIMHNIPALTAYTEEGVVAWRTRLADFRLAVMEEGIEKEWGGRAAVYYGHSGVRESHLHTLFWDDADHFYLGYYTEGENEEEFANHLFRVDVRTGKGEHLGTGQLGAVSGDAVFVVSHYPYPRIIIYKRKRDAE